MTVNLDRSGTTGTGRIIAPIETVYRGYRFRSRLEARWAVFFDAMRIPFEYEVEGFMVDGIPYLPDFVLTNTGTFVEIKPFIRGHHKEYAKSVKLLQCLAKGKNCHGVMIVGTPGVGVTDYLVHLVSEGNLIDSTNTGKVPDYPIAWFTDENDGFLGIGTLGGPVYSDRLSAALLKARSSRFEHGERGGPR